MSPLSRRIGRNLHETARRGFAREIGAAVMGMVIGVAAIHYLAVDPPHTPPASKSVDRLAADMSPEHVSMIQETSALFSPVAVVASALVVPAPAAMSTIVAPVAPALAGLPRRHVAARPPSRPASSVGAVVAAVNSPADLGPESEPLRVLGWTVPAGDLLPSGQESSRAIARVGEHIAAVGGFIAERIGLR